MSFNIKTIGNDGTVGNHPDVTSWLNTISLVGGSASSTTISALNTFCNSIDNAGLRNKFYRLNLFCGNNLISCLVPLYVNTVWNLPVLGFSIDTNVNFVSADYNETGVSGGLIGNGTTKYLLTGFMKANNLTTGHYSAYVKNTNTDVAIQRLMGGDDNYTSYLSSGQIVATFAANNNVNSLTITPGTLIFSRENNSILRYYNNGALLSTNTTNISPIENTFQYAIFNKGNVVTGQGWYSRLSGYSIGASLNSSEVSSFNSIMQTFQTSLGRNV